MWLAVAGTAVFVAIAAAQGAVRSGYDAWHQSISALSLGPGGWIQNVNFVVFGAVLLSTVPTWRRLLAGGRGARSYPRLTALVGLSFVLAALLPQDPAPGYDPADLRLTRPTLTGLLHLAVAAIAAGCSVAGLVVLATRLAGSAHWEGWARYTHIVASLMVLCIGIYAVWSRQPSGLAGTFERLAILLPAIWGFTFLRRLSKGAPFPD